MVNLWWMVGLGWLIALAAAPFHPERPRGSWPWDHAPAVTDGGGPVYAPPPPPPGGPDPAHPPAGGDA